MNQFKRAMGKIPREKKNGLRQNSRKKRIQLKSKIKPGEKGIERNKKEMKKSGGGAWAVKGGSGRYKTHGDAQVD